jgi:hypothetical protein
VVSPSRKQATSLRKGGLGGQDRSAEPRFQYESEPLIGDQRLGRLYPPQRQSRFAAIEIKHSIEQQR